jgi:bacterioferritin
VPSKGLDEASVVQQLNRILELELAGVVRYTHYSFMVYGYGRMADESLRHAQEAGELITQLEGNPSLGIGPLLETYTHDIAAILEESLKHEDEGLMAYGDLLALVEGRSVMLEEYTRRMISDETRHVGEVKKMLRPPGDG